MFQELQLFRDFQIIHVLGQGSFSIVYKIKRLKDQKFYALKVIPLATLSPQEKYNSLNEIRILASFNHQNILKLKECFIDETINSLCIITELCENGTLQNLLDHQFLKKEYIKEELIWDFLIDILKGLVVLHEQNIIHRDLKSANIFLTNSKSVKIGDFNISTIIENKFAKTQTGTPFYASPEVWRLEPYNQKSDIWSLGCMLFELCNLEPPFKGQNLHNLFMEIQKGQHTPINAKYSKQLATIAELCLTINQQERPSSKELLYHPYVYNLIKQKNILIGSNNSQLYNSIEWSQNIKMMENQFPKQSYGDEENLLYQNPQRCYKKLNPLQQLPKKVLTNNLIEILQIENPTEIYQYSKQNYSLSNKKKKKIFEPLRNSRGNNELVQSVVIKQQVEDYYYQQNQNSKKNQNQKPSKSKNISLNLSVQQNIKQINQIQLIQINNCNHLAHQQKQEVDDSISDEQTTKKLIYQFKINSKKIQFQDNNSEKQNLERIINNTKNLTDNNKEMTNYIQKIVEEVKSNKDISLKKNINTEKLIKECLKEINLKQN